MPTCIIFVGRKITQIGHFSTAFGRENSYSFGSLAFGGDQFVS